MSESDINIVIRAVTKRDPSQLPATWDGSVLPALRDALDRQRQQHEELDGATISMEQDNGSTYEAKISGRGWSRVGDIRRDSLENVLYDARDLASHAAADAMVAEVRAPAPCPVCAAIPGRICATCSSPKPTKQHREHSNIEAEVNEDDPCEASTRASADERTPLPEGWSWMKGVKCRAEHQSGERWIGVYSSTKTAYERGQIPPDVRRAVEIEAARLGLRQPDGYTFEWHRDADAIGVLRPGWIDTIWVWQGSHGSVLNAPEHAAALAWARCMLAKGRAEPKTGDRVVLPPGYEFSEVNVTTSGVARITVKTRLVSWHFYSDTLDSPQNAGWAEAHPEAFSCVRWLLREAQDAARIHDEPEQWAPKVGDRVVLPDYGPAIPSGMRIMCGRIGVVLQISDDRRHAAVKVDDEQPWWWNMDALRPAPASGGAPERAPDGYTFGVDPCGAWASVNNGTMPNGESTTCFWRRGSSLAQQNASAERWRGHEKAREWAAHLLGETAPPLVDAEGKVVLA